MHELFPILGGMVIGGLVLLIRNIPLRMMAFLLGCVLIGVAASWLSGELLESFNFISFDMLEVFLGGAVAVMAITLFMRTSYGRNLVNRGNRR